MEGELGQAKQRFSRLVSLRDDSGRLSLESVLSATALGLALLYLINDSAAASTSGAAPHPAGSGPMGGAEPTTAAGGFNPNRAQQRGAAEGIQDPDPQSSLPDPGIDPSGRLGPWSGLGSGFQPQGTVDLDTARIASQGADALPLPTGSSAFVSSDGRGFRSGSRPQSLASRSPADPTLPAEAAAQENPMAEAPEIPGFRVVLRSNETIVSRSVEGAASTDHRPSLAAITNAVIDLRNRETPQVLVSSESQLHLLALSALGDATLTLESDHSGLNKASLLVGPEANAIRIQVYETIDAGLIAGMAAQSQIHQSLIAMRDSQLQDSGHGGSLDVSSLVRFLLKAPGESLKRQLGIDLLAEAMQNSTILLGDGNDRVTLNSGFKDLEGTRPGLVINIPPAAGPDNDPSVQLRARAIGLADSRLETGGGNDQVSIKTWLDPGDVGLPTGSADLQRIALLNSSVLLGAGNDQLIIDGAVLGSLLDLGSGDNQLSIDGSVQQSSVLLGPDSRNQITLLGDTNNTLSLELAPGDRAGVTLMAGGGDDRIQARLDQLAGSIDGGGGFNTLEATAPPSIEASVAAAVEAPVESPIEAPIEAPVAAVVEAPLEAPVPAALKPTAADVGGAAAADATGATGDVLKVTLAAPGAGTVGSLDFSRIGTLRLASKEVTVSVGAQAELGGALEAAGGNAAQGHAALDYSAWQAPVQVDLGLGTASGILGGIKGFQAVLGGSGEDQLTAGDNTTRLDGGPGKDTILLNLAANVSGGQMFGGDGRDTFVLSGMEAIQAGSAAGEPALPPLWALADLSLETTASGGIGLTDILQWRQQGIQTAPGSASTTITLTSSGLEGLGQPQLLPIAPLAQLLAGMNAMALNGQQLAIAAGPNTSSLLLLGADRSYSTIAELPSLRLASNLQPNTSATATPVGMAG